MRDEDPTGAAVAELVVWGELTAVELELERELEVVEDGADELWDELGADAGALLDGDDEAGVVEASGSTYCWFPADWPSAVGAARSARAAQSRMALHALRQLDIV